MEKVLERCLAGATLGSISGGSVGAIFAAITLSQLGINLVQAADIVLSATTMNVILGVAMGTVIGIVAGAVVGASRFKTTCNEEGGEA